MIYHLDERKQKITAVVKGIEQQKETCALLSGMYNGTGLWETIWELLKI